MIPTFLLYTEGFGLTVALVGFSIVIVALALLVMVFSRLPKILNVDLKRLLTKRNHGNGTLINEKNIYNIEGNVTAAISLALHLYFNEMHDEESNIITIKKVKTRVTNRTNEFYAFTS